jgi:hypothetical protein
VEIVQNMGILIEMMLKHRYTGKKSAKHGKTDKILMECCKAKNTGGKDGKSGNNDDNDSKQGNTDGSNKHIENNGENGAKHEYTNKYSTKHVSADENDAKNGK